MCTPKKLLFSDEAKWSSERPQQQRKLSRRDLKRTKEKGKNQSSSELRLWRLSFVLFTDPARNSQPGHPTHSWAARPITRPTFSFILRPRYVGSSASDLFFCGEFSPICEKTFSKQKILSQILCFINKNFAKNRHHCLQYERMLLPQILYFHILNIAKFG
jgi:hypothetical protein